jgi:hypothetical protein
MPPKIFAYTKTVAAGLECSTPLIPKPAIGHYPEPLPILPTYRHRKLRCVDVKIIV